MGNWAVVIGINRYKEPKYQLHGAVRDAVEFAKWCIDRNGGAVPVENLTLILNPRPDDLAPGLTATEASDRDDVSAALSSLLGNSNSTGERFFFFYAGHGVTVRMDGMETPAICLSNFTPFLTNNAINLISIFERLRSTQFHEQYFFIDACRNIPFNTEFRVSDFDRPLPPTGPVWPQFIAYATQPRNTATELVSPDFEGGAFTSALLNGLKGSGAAKLWDSDKGEYLVRWNSLFEFATRCVTDQNLRGAAGRGMIQAPRQYGERGSENPVLGRFSDGGFESVSLQLNFNPSEAIPLVSLTISEWGGESREFAAPLGAMPWKVELPPRPYGVMVRSQQFRTRDRMRTVPLYESVTPPITIELEPVPPPLAFQVRTRGLFDEMTDGFAAPAEADEPQLPGAVHCPDPLAQLEVATESGQFVVAGRDTISLPAHLQPGLFRVRIVAPDGSVNETLLPMTPGNTWIEEEITPPLELTPALSWVFANSPLTTPKDGLIETSEAVGPAGFVKLSTILTLAAGAQVENRGAPPGGKLRALPLPAGDLSQRVGLDVGGVRIVVGDESLTVDLSTARIRVVETSQPIPIQLSAKTTSIGSAEAALSPGSYWVEIAVPTLGTLNTVVCVLPRRISLVILTRESDGSIDLHQYSLLVGPNEPPGPPLRDPDVRFQGARFPALRRIELMQRTYARGRTAYSDPDITFLLRSKWTDPIAGCLGGYMLVRTQRAAELRVPVENLLKAFATLPDSLVLHALYLKQLGDLAAARAAALAALDLGMPVFADGVRALHELFASESDGHARTGELIGLAWKLPLGAIFTALTQPGHV